MATETQAPGPGEQDDWKWWKDNSAAIIAVLSVAIVAIRLLAVSRGDPEIAYAILQIGGTGNVLIATLVSTLGLLAIPAFTILGYSTVHTIRIAGFRAIRSQQLIVGTFAMFLIAIYMTPILFLVYILAAILVVLLGLFPAINISARPFFITYISLYVIGLLAWAGFSPTPWLPVQAISISVTGRHETFTGYVLSQANGTTSILTSYPEAVVSVPSQGVLITEQCTPPLYRWEQATLFDLIELGKLMTYPSCPSTPYSQSDQSSSPSPTPTTASPTGSPSPTGRA